MKKKGAGSRFPVARIKKIMQADDDVGKVAQGTPVLVSKAVEMFLESLVNGAANQATNRGSKKVQSYHLKQAVHANDDFDFLKDLVTTIPDPMSEEGSNVKSEETSGKSKEKKAGVGRGRKSKVSNRRGMGKSSREVEGEDEDVDNGTSSEVQKNAATSQQQPQQQQPSFGRPDMEDDDEDEDEDDYY